MDNAPKYLKLSMATIVAATAMLALMFAGGAKQAQADELSCPAYVQVVDHDKIGRLDVPPSYYILTIADDERLTCDYVTDMFIAFLQDFDGVLPKPWKLNAKTATFTRGRKSDGVFTVTASESPPSEAEPVILPKSCGAKFTVVHNDRIGKLKIPAGKYRLTVLDKKKLTCAKAAKRFKGFLAKGNVPNTWKVKRSSATFQKKANRSVGFNINKAYGQSSK